MSAMEPDMAPVRPNVIIVVLDDMGFSDPACFGSEIETPAMDRLAAEGLRYANFSATPLCSPTRAALLTGRNHHSAQMGFLAGFGSGPDHSQERITRACGTLGEVLGAAGYATYAVGKWHLAPEEELSSGGPYENWPTGRGFQRYYGFLGGLTDQYHPALVRDTNFVEPTASDDYHLSSDLVDKAIEYLDEHSCRTEEGPFLLYLAFGAVHAPLQVPVHLVDAYVERFEKGWDQARQDRLARQIELGIAPPGTRLTERQPDTPAWDDLSPEEQRVAVRIQAAYAAFVEHTDTQIGRLLDHLDATGKARDTIVALISDNGATAGGGRTGSVQMADTMTDGVERPLSEELADLGLAGGPETFPYYAQGWAMLGNTPFRRYKSFVDAGGVRVPLIVRWPARIPDPGAVRTQFCHVIDIFPTILDVAGVAAPATVNGVAQLPVAGASLGASLSDPEAPDAHDVQYFEMLGRRAIWHEGWRAVAAHTEGADYDTDIWQLFDTSTDFSESIDLADVHPERLRHLQDAWWVEAGRHGVLPLDDRWDRPTAPRQERDRWVLLPTRSRHFVSDLIRSLSGQSFRLEAEIDLQLLPDGSVVAAGGIPTACWALVVEGASLRLLFRHGGRTVSVERPLAEQTVPERIGFDFHSSGPSDGTALLWTKPGTATASGAMPNLAGYFSLSTIYVGWCPYPAIHSTVAGRRLDGPAPGVGAVSLSRL